jgi:RHS repeat-associated protein
MMLGYCAQRSGGTRAAVCALAPHNLPGADGDPITPHVVPQGFTGQEEHDDIGVVNLNGRVYDPVVGRMMSADPFVPDPMNGQAWRMTSWLTHQKRGTDETILFSLARSAGRLHRLCGRRLLGDRALFPQRI